MSKPAPILTNEYSHLHNVHTRSLSLTPILQAKLTISIFQIITFNGNYTLSPAHFGSDLVLILHTWW